MNAITKSTGSGFSLQPNSIGEAMQMAEMLAGSQMVPKCYQNRAQDTLVAMMMGSELGLNPIQALQNIAVINGKPAIYGDALLALVQNHPKFGGHEESFDDQTMTATCTVWRKGETQRHTVTFSRADAEMAGLWNKQGPWKQYPKRMLMWRARGYALRDKFADALGGLITVEEARDIPEQDMGKAERVDQPAQEARAIPQPYPAEQFAENLPKWKAIVESGRKTAQEVIDTVESNAILSDEQRNQIKQLAPQGEAA
ncbi:recombinase RecT [Marinobacter sp.]|uniref:recombinase RecT n=1 Tax=Marinobacter sp. TaxID=50741 RepID=UPI0035665DF4